MKSIKLFDSELKVMEIIWESEPITAKEVSVIAERTISWNKNTTYTIIQKLISKKAILRTEPNFLCTSLIIKDDIAKDETNTLIEKLYNGSKKAFFASFLDSENLTECELDELKSMLEKR